MSIPKPPNPVTLSYVGVCAAVTGGLARAVFASLPTNRRRGKSPVTIGALVLGGLYGIVVWLLALAGIISEAGQLIAERTDALGIIASTAGVVGVGAALYSFPAAFIGKKAISPEDFVERAVCFAIPARVLGRLLSPSRTMSRRPTPRAPRPWDRALVEFGLPLLVGAAVILIGALIDARARWGPGATWAIATVGGFAAFLTYAIPATRRAPSRSRASQGMAIGMTTGSRPIDTGQLHPERVIVLGGRSGSNKSKIAASAVESHPDWALARCGDLVKAEARRLKRSPELPVTHPLGQELFERLGADEFLNPVLEISEIPTDAKTLIIDDVYHGAVFEAAQRRWHHLTFVEVELPANLRRVVMRELGLTDEDAETVENSELDKAADLLIQEHEPNMRLEGAVDASSVAQRGTELAQLILSAA